MGRKRLPTEMHVLNGNPSKIKDLGKGEPKPKPTVREIAPPEWLNNYGQKMWTDRCPELQRTNVLTTLDIEGFEMACYWYGIFRQCVDDAREKGLFYTYTNKQGHENEVDRPQMKLARQASELYKSYASEYGLMPSSRSKINVGEASNDKDPMEALLSGVK